MAGNYSRHLVRGKHEAEGLNRKANLREAIVSEIKDIFSLELHLR